MGFGQNLRHIMIQRDINQSQLAEITGIPQPTISQYISGGRPGSTENVLKLASALNVSTDRLMGCIPIEDETVDNDEQEMLRVLRNLNSNGKKVFLAVGKALLYDPENTRRLHDD